MNSVDRDKSLQEEEEEEKGEERIVYMEYNYKDTINRLSVRGGES